MSCQFYNTTFLCTRFVGALKKNSSKSINMKVWLHNSNAIPFDVMCLLFLSLTTKCSLSKFQLKMLTLMPWFYPIIRIIKKSLNIICMVCLEFCVTKTLKTRRAPLSKFYNDKCVRHGSWSLARRAVNAFPWSKTLLWFGGAAKFLWTFTCTPSDLAVCDHVECDKTLTPDLLPLARSQGF